LGKQRYRRRKVKQSIDNTVSQVTTIHMKMEMINGIYKSMQEEGTESQIFKGG
jgi:hypothetical protein